MNETAETHIMKNGLSPAKQNAILSTREWIGDSKVKVLCTHHTEPLLRAAGVSHPEALHFYEVPVMRDRSGFLVLAHCERPPQVSSDDAPMEVDWLLDGDPPPAAAARPKAAAPAPVPLGFFEEIRENVQIRRFEIRTGDNKRVRVEILAYDDHSLPSPSEPEQWQSRTAKDIEVHSAISALHMARDLAHFER